MTPPAAGAVRRFAATLDPLVPPESRIGIAVSGGPDSLALLLLAHGARPGKIEAATVDHGLRQESAEEAVMVADICADLGVVHQVLLADWPKPPNANVQAAARTMRYRLLNDWAIEHQIAAVATAHHADDQAETLLMRLARGSGVAGLGGSRAKRWLSEQVALVRPLLGWRKEELVSVVRDAGLTPIDDPSNRNAKHDRTRVRQLLEQADWLDPARLAVSASAIHDADVAIDWALAPLIESRISRKGDLVFIDPAELPLEFKRRLLVAAFAEFAAEPARGPELMRAIEALEAGRTVTLSGLRLAGGDRWQLSAAAPRRRQIVPLS